MKNTIAFIFLFACAAKLNAQTAPLPESKHKFIVIAHRGDHVEVPENTITRYRNAGLDIEKNNGTNGKFLPVPAVYVIDKQSTITYRFFEPDYKKRPWVKDILANL